jgi:hypothetical protein
MHQHQQYPVSDLYGWIKNKTLITAPEFQRGDIWAQPVQSFFIDTLLRDLPVPPIYIRMKTDAETKTSYREVVDGQQRLNAIVKFIDGALPLDKRSRGFAGKTFDRLEEDQQQLFLSYQVGVEQLFGADDDTVLDIFQRMNAYRFSLNKQELRNGRYLGGKYQGEFRLAVIRASQRWEILWSKYGVISVRNRVRLLHHELVAQLLGIILDGVTDGGQPKIDRLYERYDSANLDEAVDRFDDVCEFIVGNFSTVLRKKLGGAPHFMMVFAAVAHALIGIPEGDMGGEHPELPCRDLLALSDVQIALDNLMALAMVFDTPAEAVPTDLAGFKVAIAGTTQRIRSRSVRFETLYRALLPVPVDHA